MKIVRRAIEKRWESFLNYEVSWYVPKKRELYRAILEGYAKRPILFINKV